MGDTTLKPWKSNESGDSSESSNVWKRILYHVLGVIWTVVGILTYLFDAEPLNAWIIIWASVATLSVAVICSICCSGQRIWLLRCWRRITCRDCKPKTDTDSVSSDFTNDNNPRSNNTARQVLRTILSISMPYFRESQGARWLFCAMMTVVLMNSAVSVAFSFAMKNFYNALNEGDAEVFRRAMIKYAITLFAYAPIIALYSYQRERLAVHWRDWMTKRTLHLYGHNRVYYLLEREGEIDNPDQRIAEDVNSFCSYSLRLLVMIIKNFINLISFSIILYTIAPQLFLVIVIYVIFGTMVTVCLGKPLVHLNFTMLQREADFRFSLVRLRENAESVAFYGGEDLELSYIHARFAKVIFNRIAIIVKQLQLEVFTNIYFYMTWIIPVAVVAPLYFRGEIELGSVTQAREAFVRILDDVSILINEFADISKFSAGIFRLSSFYDAMEKAGGGEDGQKPHMLTGSKDKNDSVDDTSSSSLSTEAKKPGIEIMPLLNAGKGTGSGNLVLGVNQVTIWTPGTHRDLIRDLNFSLREGENLMIVGNSGAGKSSFLRCIAGLWNAGEGAIERPSDEYVYFLPQRPYCALGSLRDQLLYPSFAVDSDDAVAINFGSNNNRGTSHTSRCHALTDQELLDILDLVNLSKLAYDAGKGDPVAGLDAVEDWSNILSLGEQQRLGFARVFVNRPRLLIMDEATSALDTNTESQMYNILERMANASREQKQVMIPTEGNSSKKVIPFKPIEGGLTYVSVGHRPSLLAYHCKKLLVRETGYEMKDIDQEEASKIAALASSHLLL
mmetsp:Transcript_19478/g.29287  ORF Transcript_19478/g.29287 Transcript_19478/m.29287 type:complete len:788 (-) Transcript_19478:7-2370(-)